MKADGFALLKKALDSLDITSSPLDPSHSYDAVHA